MILCRKSEKDGKTSARLPLCVRIFSHLICLSLNLENIITSRLESNLWNQVSRQIHSNFPFRMSCLARFFFTYAFRKRARASESRCEISHASRVKPCVTHDIYKGFSIRKTHIIETTCNILTYAVIQ